MSDTVNDDKLIDAEKIERLRAIFNRERKLETDEDLIELAKLVEDESDEAGTYIDHVFDRGPVN